MATRACGECIACCVYPRITDPELTKAGMTHCPHLTLPGEEARDSVYYSGGNGCKNCTIYDNQPKMCSDYKCAWRVGHGEDEDRPDKSLILVDNAHRVENAMQAKPLAPDQEKTPEARAAITRMSASMGVPIIVLNFYERRVQYVIGGGA